jgi:hypothetical protein
VVLLLVLLGREDLERLAKGLLVETTRLLDQRMEVAAVEVLLPLDPLGLLAPAAGRGE